MAAKLIASPLVAGTLSVKIMAGKKGKAYLLGATGEQLRSYTLTAEVTELPLQDLRAGIYSLRVEAGSDVMVEQFIIP